LARGRNQSGGERSVCPCSSHWSLSWRQRLCDRRGVASDTATAGGRRMCKPPARSWSRCQEAETDEHQRKRYDEDEIEPRGSVQCWKVECRFWSPREFLTKRQLYPLARWRHSRCFVIGPKGCHCRIRPINLVRGPAAVDADPELIGCSPLPARVRGHDRTPLNVTGAARRKLTAPLNIIALRTRWRFVASKTRRPSFPALRSRDSCCRCRRIF
jgi:hypothetical protein